MRNFAREIEYLTLRTFQLLVRPKEQLPPLASGVLRDEPTEFFRTVVSALTAIELGDLEAEHGAVGAGESLLRSPWPKAPNHHRYLVRFRFLLALLFNRERHGGIDPVRAAGQIAGGGGSGPASPC